jgi:hypothetical protein
MYLLDSGDPACATEGFHAMCAIPGAGWPAEWASA